MRKLASILAVSTLTAGIGHASTTLYSDLFDNGNTVGAFDGSTTPEVNLLGSAYQLQSYGLAQQNKNDRLHFQQTAAIGGVRFGSETGRFNWADGTVGSTIVAGDGLHISFDMRTGNGGDYIAFGFGMGGADPTSSAGYGTVYADTTADWGIRFENDRMISFEGGTTTPIYRTDTSDGGANAYNFGNYNVFHVDLYLELTSFDAGSVVTASAVLSNGSTTITMNDFDSWTLDNTDDFIWDIAGHQNTGSEVLMYDLNVSTINAVPEPSVALLGGLGLLGLLRRRRA